MMCHRENRKPCQTLHQMRVLMRQAIQESERQWRCRMTRKPRLRSMPKYHWPEKFEAGTERRTGQKERLSIARTLPGRLLHGNFLRQAYRQWTETSKTAKLVWRMPRTITNQTNAALGNLLIINAYITLPMYSKKSDQLGPFRGNISPLPRTS